MVEVVVEPAPLELPPPELPPPTTVVVGEVDVVLVGRGWVAVGGGEVVVVVVGGTVVVDVVVLTGVPPGTNTSPCGV